ncbi:thiamine-phosphate pyrophosphorylase [Actinoplanes octamycinicus]|uniref:Thiamine-phosphate pyrophosphorylase n=1 Tax=Actinoplanes octamycinicus TaxID=135948 RepID=A0A7W7M6L4_9ACTN|nr:thiamine phosphate synthase [Actinoplanes octamycinicus]MBB4738870.1 thiamine-phosphate pyrophosphorylase [Actinoplanes octamycinicus]GIE63192.1 putative thiamine-phosphate synthase [Actinoplanes octamycinicus]
MVTPGGLVVLTDRRSAAGPLVETIAAAVRGGASWVVLRERDLPRDERAELAAKLRAVVPAGRLIVAGPDPLGGNAVHLAAADLVPAGVPLVGRSWHGTEPLSDVDYVTLSPIYLTSTKPGYGPALGVVRAAELAGEMPWLALGGVDSAARAAECAGAGAAGIAVLGAIMRAANPERVARTLAGSFAAAQGQPPPSLGGDPKSQSDPGPIGPADPLWTAEQCGQRREVRA